ncbi:MAG: ABC transporter ATP-binding protein [Saprospiraceae bacterium]|nr:ABC transporter ATP-binding protein [Saprospiraceae bacterium]
MIKIKNLHCGYAPGKPVLYVDDLNLAENEITFMLGPSGIGKSTLIEALGLINDTILDSTSSHVLFQNDRNQYINLNDLWLNNKSKLETFRRNYFSFIFQNNYLMPNLSAGENMMMTLLMKGENETEAKDKILYYMDKVGLDEELFDKKVVHLSGGQKQRLAFVRAIASPFKLLIGDEPTGNLDAMTADKLMGYATQSIRESNRSALFVSHDINLALRYADTILLFKFIKKEVEMGLLSDSEALKRLGDKWYHAGREIANPHQLIMEVFLQSPKML